MEPIFTDWVSIFMFKKRQLILDKFPTFQVSQNIFLWSVIFIFVLSAASPVPDMEQVWCGTVMWWWGREWWQQRGQRTQPRNSKEANYQGEDIKGIWSFIWLNLMGKVETQICHPGRVNQIHQKEFRRIDILLRLIQHSLTLEESLVFWHTFIGLREF